MKWSETLDWGEGDEAPIVADFHLITRSRCDPHPEQVSPHEQGAAFDRMTLLATSPAFDRLGVQDRRRRLRIPARGDPDLRAQPVMNGVPHALGGPRAIPAVGHPPPRQIVRNHPPLASRPAARRRSCPARAGLHTPEADHLCAGHEPGSKGSITDHVSSVRLDG